MKELIAPIGIIVITVFVMSLLLAVLTMMTWNSLIPSITGFQEITFWQAFWLNFLGRLLTNDSSNTHAAK